MYFLEHWIHWMLLDFNKFSFVLFGSMVLGWGSWSGGEGGVRGGAERKWNLAHYPRYALSTPACVIRPTQTKSNIWDMWSAGNMWQAVWDGQRVSLACVHGLGGTLASWCCPVSGGLSISRHRFHEKINHPRNKVDALKLEQSLLPSKMTSNKLHHRYFDTS